jgi:hypothetical protein
MRIVVYSAWFGHYEPLNRQSMGDGVGYDRVLLTDDPGLHLEGVRTIVLPVSSDAKVPNSPALASRLAKLCPHRFFADYDWAIHVDNSASLRMSPADIIRHVTDEFGAEPPPGRYLFRHRRRTCAYREARVCMVRGRIPRKSYRQEVALMQAAGFPQEAGLYVNTVMVQRMGDAITDGMNEAWLAHVSTLSGRDQISLPFEMWRAGLQPKVLTIEMTDTADWPVFRNWRRRMYRNRHGVVVADGNRADAIVRQDQEPQTEI